MHIALRSTVPCVLTELSWAELWNEFTTQIVYDFSVYHKN